MKGSAEVRSGCFSGPAAGRRRWHSRLSFRGAAVGGAAGSLDHHHPLLAPHSPRPALPFPFSTWERNVRTSMWGQTFQEPLSALSPFSPSVDAPLLPRSVHWESLAPRTYFSRGVYILDCAFCSFHRASRQRCIFVKQLILIDQIAVVDSWVWFRFLMASLRAFRTHKASLLLFAEELFQPTVKENGSSPLNFAHHSFTLCFLSSPWKELFSLGEK